MKVIPLLFLVCFVVTARAEELDSGGTTVQINRAPATEITGSISDLVSSATELAEFCMSNPYDPKCVGRREAKKAKIRDTVELYKEGLRDPEVREWLLKEMDREANNEMRKEHLKTIKKMCDDSRSEACRIAKEDYAEFKAKHAD